MAARDNRRVTRPDDSLPDAHDDDARRSQQAQARFWQRLADALAAGTLQRLVFAQPDGVQPDDLLRLTGRPLQLRGQACVSRVYRHRTRDITKNLPAAEALALLPTLAGKPGFRKLHLFTATEESQLSFSKRGKALLSTQARAAEAHDDAAPSPAVHDREKQRWIDIHAPFLQALGVTTAQGTVVPAMARKWKQINKFVEVFAHALKKSALADAPVVKVADFGAGRGYLTFAIHDWLRAQGKQPQVTGVELRDELVNEAQATIARLGLQGLTFEAGDVRTVAPGAMNVMIALHA